MKNVRINILKHRPDSITIRYSLNQKVSNRGGVEDTRLEAKAKDTKKFRGQGPRTQTQVFSRKKKVFKKFFSGNLKKKGLQKSFSGEKDLQKFFSGDLYLRKPKKRSLQIFCKVFGVFQQNFNGSKIVLSSS